MLVNHQIMNEGIGKLVGRLALRLETDETISGEGRIQLGAQKEQRHSLSQIRLHLPALLNSDLFIHREAALPCQANRHGHQGVLMTSDAVPGRSEEHTSELQSRGHLVC